MFDVYFHVPGNRLRLMSGFRTEIWTMGGNFPGFSSWLYRTACLVHDFGEHHVWLRTVVCHFTDISTHPSLYWHQAHPSLYWHQCTPVTLLTPMHTLHFTDINAHPSLYWHQCTPVTLLTSSTPVTLLTSSTPVTLLTSMHTRHFTYTNALPSLYLHQCTPVTLLTSMHTRHFTDINAHPSLYWHQCTPVCTTLLWPKLVQDFSVLPIIMVQYRFILYS